MAYTEEMRLVLYSRPVRWAEGAFEDGRCRYSFADDRATFDHYELTDDEGNYIQEGKLDSPLHIPLRYYEGEEGKKGS